MRWVVLWVVFSLASSGCLGKTGTPDGPTAPAVALDSAWIRNGEDVSADARELTEAQASALGRTACRASMPTYGPCAGAMGAADGTAPAGLMGVPADPALDLLGLEVRETVTTIHVAFVVARVDERFEASVPDDEVRAPSAQWTACWGGEGETACATVWVLRQGGTLNAQPQFRREGPDCDSGDTSCAWSVPMVVEAGSPGRIVLEVPRTALLHPEVGAELGPWTAQSVRGERAGEFGVAYAQASAVGAWGMQPRRYYYVVDEIDDLRPVVFSLPFQRPESGNDGPHEDRVGDVSMAGRYGPGDTDHMDIESVDLVETSAEVTIATHLRRVDVQVQEFAFDGVLRIANGPFVLYGVIDEGQGRVPYAFQCSGECDEYVAVPVQMEIHHGSPGWMNLSFARSDLGSPQAGARVDLAWVRTLAIFQTASLPDTPLPVYGGASLGGMDDWSTPLPLQFLSLNTTS